MKNTILRKSITVLCVLIIVLCTVLIAVQGTSSMIASATIKEYSDVLDDLKKDNTFDVAHYPVVADDYSLKVIQIAESTDKELFVYVYQPSGNKKDLQASSINISITINNEINYHNYQLTYLNSSGVFYKYVVNKFTVRNESTRYYSISSIYRPFDEKIDKKPDGNNTVTEVNFEVSKQYCFSEINGKPYVSVVDIETIVITDKFVGFVRYDEGFILCPRACDSHFVAFNTDRPIDKLIEADVCYSTQSFYEEFGISPPPPTYGEKKTDNYAYLKEGDIFSDKGGGILGTPYEYARIQTIDEFLSSANIDEIVYKGVFFDVSSRLTNEAKSELKGKQWVLRFAETDYRHFNSGVGYGYSGCTIVGDVTILRLKFEYDGITYNLGTIDNKQSGSDTPVNETKLETNDKDWWKWLLFVLVALLILVLLSATGILPLLCKFIVWLICLPFKLLSALFKAIFKRKDREKQSKKIKK